MARSIALLVLALALAVDLGCSGARPASVDAGPEVGVGHRVLTKVIDNAPWKGLQHVGGMAVDAQNRVYFEDTENVWLVDGQNVTKYLTLAEATAQIPPTVTAYISDLDRGPDGLIYVAVSGFGDMGNLIAAVLRSSSPHVVQRWLDVSSINAARMSVVAADRVAVVNVGGLYAASLTGQTLAYPNAMLDNAENCAAQDLTAAPTGTFLYQPGCNGSPLYRGNVDGSGVAKVTGFNLSHICTARDPKGGFYIVVDDFPPGATRIYHLADGATDAADATLVETTPSLAEVAQMEMMRVDPVLFMFCSMAAASDGTLFLQTFQQLWRVSP